MRSNITLALLITWLIFFATAQWLLAPLTGRLISTPLHDIEAHLEAIAHGR